MVFELKLYCSKIGAGGSPCWLAAVISWYARHSPLFTFLLCFWVNVLCLNCNIQYVGMNFVSIGCCEDDNWNSANITALWYFLYIFSVFNYASQDKQNTYQISLSQFPLSIVATMKIFNRMIENVVLQEIVIF